MSSLIVIFNTGGFYTKASYIITLYFFLALVFSLGKKIPLKEITLFIISIQYLLSPSIDYEYLGRYTYFNMRIDEDRYFSYVFPAFLAFALGLLFPLGRHKKSELELLGYYKLDKHNNEQMGKWFVIVGLVFTAATLVIQIPGLAFLVTLVSLLKYVGLLYLWLSGAKNTKVWFLVVFFISLYQTLAEAIFINFIVTCFLFFCFYALQNKINPYKAILVGLLSFCFLFMLQTVKSDYRKGVWFQGTEQNKLFFLAELISKQASNLNQKELLQNAARVNYRMNQGWVMQRILVTIPDRRPFLNGKIFYDELAGIFLPRLLFANKAVVQSSEKFEQFAGYKLRNYTIAVGIPGDGYGNFGPQGGVIFCFFVALFFNLTLYIFYRLSSRYPTLLLWSPLIFFYLMRAGDDFYIIANWIVKSAIMVAVFYMLTKQKTLRLKYIS